MTFNAPSSPHPKIGREACVGGGDEARPRAQVAGHFGEWMQGRLGPDGPLALITVAQASLGVALFKVGEGDFTVEGGVSATARGARLLSALGAAPVGQFHATSDAPPGGGAGVSTALLIALAKLTCGARSERDLAAACLAAEGAVDPLMYRAPDRLLWAPRRALALRPSPPPPAAEVVGGFWGAPQMTDPFDQNFPDVSDLIARWVEAAAQGDLAAAANIAAQSALRTTRARGPRDDPTGDAARRLGALGWLRAHTGSARGLIFPLGGAPSDAEKTIADLGYQGVLTFRTGGVGRAG